MADAGCFPDSAESAATFRLRARMSDLPLAPWLGALLAAALSALTLGLLESGRGHLPQDQPTDRSLHDRPVSRVGGLAIWAGFLPVAVLGAFPMASAPVVLAASIAVAAVSLADDWRGVRPAVRLGVHALAALAVATMMLRPDLAAAPMSVQMLALAGTAIVFVWSANLFNFMDGNDGLAALMAICGFGAFGAAAMIAGAPAGAYLALAAATLPFLAVNVPPARTFMGDGGSIPLGFLAGVFGLSGIRAGTWPEWFPLLVFLPFVADTTVTMIRRIARGEHLFEPHKTHYYQRLHRMGAGHAGTLLFYGVLIAGTSASALFTLTSGPAAGWRVLGAWTAAIGVLFAGIDYHWRKFSPGP
jgi:UDP-N-acetylmuramyl pentapeptide phosphotransferase/UDP-N-acetylglucosamine-1-phosphate transferase